MPESTSDTPPNMDELTLSDSELDLSTDDATTKNDNEAEPKSPAPRYSPHDTAEAREAALKHELASLRAANTAIESAIASLHKASSDLGTVSTTVSQTSTLLNTWTRILSQTEHNQRLILSPQWQGANQDLQDIEEEAAERVRAAERREIEERMRREAAARKAEDEARRREAAAAAPSKPGTKGRARARAGATATTRGTRSTTPTGYVNVGGQAGRGMRGGTSRAGSTGIGRGVRGMRRGAG
jgi:hypothetical protein